MGIIPFLVYGKIITGYEELCEFHLGSPKVRDYILWWNGKRSRGSIEEYNDIGISRVDFLKFN